MPWRLFLTRRAEKDLGDVPPQDRESLRRALSRLTTDPAGSDLRKLAGREDEWRLRVGRWRAILQLDTAAGTMTVLRVLPRSEAYR